MPDHSNPPPPPPVHRNDSESTLRHAIPHLSAMETPSNREQVETVKKRLLAITETRWRTTHNLCHHVTTEGHSITMGEVLCQAIEKTSKGVSPLPCGCRYHFVISLAVLYSKITGHCSIWIISLISSTFALSSFSSLLSPAQSNSLHTGRI